MQTISIKYSTAIVVLLVGLCLLQGGAAQSCILPNCISCPNPYTCQTCPVGYNCCQQSCSTCVNQTQCKACYSPYILNSTTQLCQLTSSCFQIACTSCDEDNVCDACLDTFVLDVYTYQCIMCPYACLSCTANLTCIECMPAFYNNNGVCDLCQVSNCLVCTLFNICLLCQPGYILNSNTGLCMSCPLNCLACTNPSSCQVCQPSYYLTQNLLCKQCDSACDSCIVSSTNCTDCDFGAFLYNGICIPCYKYIPLCIQCQLDNSKSQVNIYNKIGKYIQQIQIICIDCGFTMYLYNNTCNLCIDGCQICNDGITCQQCLPDYYTTDNNTCLQCNINNCIDCNDVNTCQECQSSYYLTTVTNLTTNITQVVCVACQQGCQSCTGPTSCQYCYDGYALANGVCTACSNNCKQCIGSPSICVKCIYGYYLIALVNVNRCVPCPNYCGACYGTNLCTYCLAGAYLNGTSCISCPVNNCYNCNTTGTQIQPYCSLCNNGYFLSPTMNQCISCIQNCLLCINSTNCTQCNQGYYYNNNICLKCIQNCIACNNIDNCIQCNNGYYLDDDNNICVLCPLGCDACYSNTTCITCYNSYFINSININNTLCMPCSSPCYTCINATTCMSCLPGYKMQQGACFACPTGFEICSGNVNVVKCFDGYALTYQNLSNVSTWGCAPCPPNCYKCLQININGTANTNISCSQCQIGYILLSNQTCFSCASTQQNTACQSCNAQGVCTACFQGYSLNQNSFCELDQVDKSSEWPLIGADIALGCLAMILLIILLCLKLNKPIRPSNLDVELTDQN